MKALKELVKARTKYQKKIQDAGKNAVEEAARSVFDAHKEINRIEWTQYTPYFNDGEPCTFGVHDVYFLGNAEGGDSRWAEEREDKIEVAKGYGENRKVLLKAADDFSQLVSDNEDLMGTLGEGKVVITREGGLELEEYDHD